MVLGSTKTGFVINIMNSCSSEHKSASPIGRTSPFVWYPWHIWSVIADCISSTLLYEILKPSVNTLLIVLFFCVHDCKSEPVLTGRAVFWKDRWRTLTTFCSRWIFRALTLISWDSFSAVFLFWLSMSLFCQRKACAFKYHLCTLKQTIRNWVCLTVFTETSPKTCLFFKEILAHKFCCLH